VALFSELVFLNDLFSVGIVTVFSMLEFCVVDEIEVVLFSISLLASTSFFVGLSVVISALVLESALRAILFFALTVA